MLSKKVSVVLSPEAENTFLRLSESKRDRKIEAAVRKKAELIKGDIHYGDAIAKKLIPKEYIERYRITNLFRVELPGFWRMLYTLAPGETDQETVEFILSHPEYARKFGYN